MRSYFTLSMLSETRRIEAATGPTPDGVVVVVVSGLSALFATTAPPSTTPAAAAPAPAPMRKLRRVTDSAGFSWLVSGSATGSDVVPPVSVTNIHPLNLKLVDGCVSVTVGQRDASVCLRG